MDKDPNIQFMSLDEFKSAIGKAGVVAQVVKNPNTDKLFLAIDSQRYKCKSDINPKLPMSMLIPSIDINGDPIKEENRIAEACLVNVDNTANVLFSV